MIGTSFAFSIERGDIPAMQNSTEHGQRPILNGILFNHLLGVPEDRAVIRLEEQMAWKSSAEIDQMLSALPEIEQIERAYCLSVIAENSVYPEFFEPAEEWNVAVVPTNAGELLLRDLQHTPLSHLALFGYFFHQEPLVDCASSDLDCVEKLISTSLLNRCALLPQATGRELYDKFNDQFSTNLTEHLDPPEVLQLLENTPIGVYQVGRIVVGPLGLLRSADARWMPPSLFVPLWHCSDTGCDALHFIQLRSGHLGLTETYESIAKTAHKDAGPASEWEGTLIRRLLRPDGSESEILFADILPFIASCIVGSDRKYLVTAMLQGEQRQNLRAQLEESPRSSEFQKCDAEAIASRLSSEDQLQLLAVVPTRELVTQLDRMVLERRIEVQPEERRRAKLSPPRISRRDLRTELASLGLRSVGNRPLIRLNSAILRAYDEIGGLDDLRWRVRASERFSTRLALADYIDREGPKTALRELVFPDRRVFERISEGVWLDITGSDSENILPQLLWKIGFSYPRYAGAVALLLRRLTDFNQCLLSVGSVESEIDREEVRKSGVNLFVSLEDFLERLVSFNVWLCSSDHFLDTRFEYSRAAAVEQVPRVLGESIESGTATLSWSTGGENTIGTALAYLAKLVEWLTGLADSDSSRIRRAQEDVPHYAEDADQVFAFWHTQAWADFDRVEFESYVGRLRAVVEQLSKSELASIRNGLDHKRRDDRFPTIDSMISTVSRVRHAVELADSYRLIPKRYWLYERREDHLGRGSLILKDYSGQPYSLRTPSPVVAMRGVAFTSPVVIGPGNLLAKGMAPIVFSIRSSGEYASYWEGYPRRRKIPPPGSTAERTSGASDGVAELQHERERRDAPQADEADVG